MSTEGTKKHERDNPVLFRVFRVFRGPSLLYFVSAFVVPDSGAWEPAVAIETSTDALNYR
ncbi:MAG: hypothetical protein [Olavius algarvensis Gamma 1 endosymbiont]|nr:MAG: hypothetical protein [Olavius algarvensis Gamma 1 endosymbiont]